MKLTQLKLMSIEILEIGDLRISISGSYGLKVTPVPMPNTKVKLQSANGTAGVALWESRSLPD